MAVRLEGDVITADGAVLRGVSRGTRLPAPPQLLDTRIAPHGKHRTLFLSLFSSLLSLSLAAFSSGMSGRAARYTLEREGIFR